MNYNSVIIVGVVMLTAIWWFVHASRHYPGPRVMHMYINEGQVLVDMPGSGDPVPVTKEKE
jgi:choline transport protein